MQIGETIRMIRERQKMKQVELAEKCNISPVYLCNLEKGRFTPSVETIKNISGALGIPPSYILFFSLTEDEVPEDKRQTFTYFLDPLKRLLLGEAK